MTVKELILKLSVLPSDAVVEDGEELEVRLMGNKVYIARGYFDNLWGV